VRRARELDLSFDGVSALSHVEIVNESRETVWSGNVMDSAGRMAAKVGISLPPGSYYARVTAPAQLPREFAFRVVN
jgi:hypothetical protein